MGYGRFIRRLIYEKYDLVDELKVCYIIVLKYALEILAKIYLNWKSVKGFSSKVQGAR
jgi:hypothetical protein